MTKKRHIKSILHPNDFSMIMCKKRLRSSFKAPTENGTIKKSMLLDLNIHFNKSEINNDREKYRQNLHSRHWPLHASVREIMANAIDAVLQNMSELGNNYCFLSSYFSSFHNVYLFVFK
jgi:hypothetical protein